MIQVKVVVANVAAVLAAYNQIKVYRSDQENGTYTEITNTATRLIISPDVTIYAYNDSQGLSSHWYKTAYFNSVTLAESPQSGAQKGSSEIEKVGYTFGNYTPTVGDWGKVYTADDMRYTMFFGIDCVGSDVAVTEFTDAQFDQLVLESLSEFENLLTIDIRKRVYKTFGAQDTSRASLIRGKYWRDGIDYTDTDDPYEFDPNQWTNYTFFNLRHYPLLSVERAVWYSPVKGEVMDMVANGWIRIANKNSGQVNMFPTGGFSYGPYSVYGPLWSYKSGGRYPQAFEFDYTTGYEDSSYIPESLRSVIGKYATIKALAVIGDGILAGFSSQSISLDGLSESFSSTQSATSAMFGARIKQYSDEIKDWLLRNRYKYGPPPFSFVGA